MIFLAVLGVAAELAADLPPEWQPAEVVREAEDFDRGNVRRAAGAWGAGDWCILNAEQYPNRAEYDFTVTGGWYQLLVRYAAEQSRPVSLVVDDRERGTACAQTTGTWREDTARWFLSGLLQLAAGQHVVRFERDQPIPHLDCWALARLPGSVISRPRPDGSWSVGFVGERQGQPPGAVPPGPAYPGVSALPGQEVWLTIPDPERKAGPVVPTNLNVSGRLARVESWVQRAWLMPGDLAPVLGPERAQQVLKGVRSALDLLRAARDDEDELARGLWREGAARAGAHPDIEPELRGLLRSVERLDTTSRRDVFASLACVGKAHLALRKRCYFTLVGNQLLATGWSCDLDQDNGRPVGPRRHAPGIVSLSYYPPGGLTYFGVSRPVARLELRRSGRAVDLVLDEQASDWYPHVLHTEYFVQGGGRVIQDLCVAGDVAVARLTTRYLPDGLEAVVVGEPLTGQPPERVQGDERGASLALTGRGQGLAQAVALSHPAAATSTPEGYALALGDPKALTGGLVIAAALRPDEATAAHEARWAVERAADCFADAQARWADYFGRLLPRFVSPDVRLMDLYYTTAYVLWADRYVMPEGGMWRHPYVVPSKWTWRGIWPEDLSHCLTGLRWLNDPDTAYGCLRVIRDHFFSPTADPGAKVHAYGLLTLAAWRIFERYGDLGFVREIYPTLRAMNDFIATKCDEDGDGLPAMGDSFRLGWDSSRRYDWKGNLVEARHFRKPIEPVDCAVYFWRQTEHLAAMAEALGAGDDAAALRERAQRTWRALNEALWHQETGYFYDVMAETGEQCLIKSCAGLFPLIGGRLPDERREALLAHLRNPEEFWAAYPVPCLALHEPNFGTVWSGASCLRNNWLVYRGLLDCGLDEAAGDLAARTFDLLALTPPDAMNEGYYFDPRDGRPRADQLGNLFSTPLAGVLDMIVTGVCGLRPRATGEWEVRPVPGLQPEWWVLAGLDRRVDRIKVAGGRGQEVTVSADTHQ